MGKPPGDENDREDDPLLHELVAELLVRDGAGHAVPPGTKFGRYVLEHRLGAGGMSVVYAARDPELERRVAIKVLRAEAWRGGDRAQARARLVREARAMARLTHPNVLPVFDVGAVGDEVFIAMELVDGTTLRGWLRERTRGWREVIERFVEAGRGLRAAHAAGLVHRDFKPENVLVGQDGRVRVADFGLVRDAAGDAASDGARDADADASGAAAPQAITRTGAAMGTPAYMAPEQRAGRADARSDQYSFCVALYEALHGRRPSEPAAGGARDPDVPAWLDGVVARGMRESPDHRYPSMDALLEALVHRPALARPVLRAGLWALAPISLVAALAVAGARFRHAPESAPRLAPRVEPAPPLTTLGGCAYAPTFAGDALVFDATLDGRESDLYRLTADGPRQLTDAPTEEWRAAPGRRPGEIIFPQTDPHAADLATSGRVLFRDLATGAEEVALPLPTPSAVVARGAIYYVRIDETELRARAHGNDSLVLAAPPGRGFLVVSASPDGTRLALVTILADDSDEICLVDLTRPAPALDCPGLTPVWSGRPAFSPAGDAFYFAAADGIRRFDLASRRAELVLPGRVAAGGLAVSPDGARLVYSDCRPAGPIVDVSRPERPIAVNEPNTVMLAAAPGGLLAYVRKSPGASVLVVRSPDGSTRELTSPALGTPSDPSFDARGARLAYVMHGPRPGIYVRDLATEFQPAVVTTGANDSMPAWLRDGELAFVRLDDAGRPSLYTVGADGGGEPRAASITRPRLIGGASRLTGELLLYSTDFKKLFSWNPETGLERSVAEAALGDLHFDLARLSVDGRWALIQGGPFSGRLWKLLLADPKARLVPVVDVGANDTISQPAVMLEDGRILAAVKSYRGELHAEPAPSGARW